MPVNNTQQRYVREINYLINEFPIGEEQIRNILVEVEHSSYERGVQETLEKVKAMALTCPHCQVTFVCGVNQDYFKHVFTQTDEALTQRKKAEAITDGESINGK